MDHGATHGAAHDSHGSHTGIGQYMYVFGALCLLTLCSFWTYADWPIKWPFHHQPAVGWSFMMAVSCTKAMLVILFFMHVKYETSWKYVLTFPPAIMAIFLILALVPDIGLRNRRAIGGRVPSEDRLAQMAEPHAETSTPSRLQEDRAEGEH